MRYGAYEEVDGGSLNAVMSALIKELGRSYMIFGCSEDIREAFKQVTECYKLFLDLDAGEEFLADNPEHLRTTFLDILLEPINLCARFLSITPKEE
jgi:hypothetical protein